MKHRVALMGLWGHTGYTTTPVETMPDTEIVAVCETDPGLLRRFRRQDWFIKANQYGDHREMLAKEKPDIVAVYAIHGESAQMLIDAALAGCNIYTEKPLTTTLADLKRLRDVVRESGVDLTMMLDMRFRGIYRRLRSEIYKGTLGEITQATAQKSYKVGSRPDWVKTRETYAGIIPYIGCHALDLIRWTTGLEFVKGAAFHNNVGRPDLGAFENSASISILADNGATVSTRLDYCRPGTAASWGDDRIRVVGVDGVIEEQHGRLTLITKNKTLHELTPEASLSQFRNFVSYLDGNEPLELSADDAFRITEVILKLHNAADRHELVML